MKNHVSHVFAYSAIASGCLRDCYKLCERHARLSGFFISPDCSRRISQTHSNTPPFQINMKPNGEIHARSKGTNLPPACFTPLCLIDRNCTHQRKRTLRFNGHKMDISILKRRINTLIRAIFNQHFQ